MFSAMRSVIPDIQRRGTHMHTCNVLQPQGLCKMHSKWISNHTPNFSAICPAVPETWESGILVKTYALVHLSPSLTYAKCLANLCLTTYQILVQSIWPFLIYQTMGNICTRGAESEPESELKSPGVMTMTKESESESIKWPRLLLQKVLFESVI